MHADFPGARERWHVAVVDDDIAVLRGLARMLTVRGFEVTTFNSPVDFLSAVGHIDVDILLVDLRMPDLDGLSLQAALTDRDIWLPTVFLSAHGDVSTSVRALRSGAVDFLEKPCDEPTLLAALSRVTDLARAERDKTHSLHNLKARVSSLTRREHEVFTHVVTGQLNKQIAAQLGTTEKTIKVHRARVMAKMHATSIPDLVRMFDRLALSSSGGPSERAPSPRQTSRAVQLMTD
jgi:FixJ family two-component response regulator